MEVNDYIDEVLNEVHRHQYNGGYEKALEVIKPLIDQVEDANFALEDDENVYRSFCEYMQLLVCQHYSDTTKQIQWYDIPLYSIYSNYASVLLDLKLFDESRIATKKALAWNPVAVFSIYEYAETYKASGEEVNEDFVKIITSAFKYCYKPTDFAKGLRELGWYYVEKELYDVAVCCYELSTYYDSKSKCVESELEYIADKTGRKYDKPSLEEIKKCAAEYNFPIEPSKEIVSLLKICVKEASDTWINSHKDSDMETLKYFSGLKHNLLNDDVYGMPRLMRWGDRFKK